MTTSASENHRNVKRVHIQLQCMLGSSNLQKACAPKLTRQHNYSLFLPTGTTSVTEVPVMP